MMREIAADSALKEYVNMLPCRALKDRLFAFYVKGGRAGLCYRIYACLFFFKNTFDGFYRRFRKRMMLKRAEKTQ
ncbi:MAG TPA: hypothetical protein DEQ02_04490 [Ruminococcaceae bacterium]|nr:hypothetical protein [Oscillospiraceae bacterium]